MEARRLHSEPILTDDQERARENIMARLQLGARHISLLGYAGTGKTFLAGQIASDLQDKGQRVYACAPTHKAARVLDGRLHLGAQTVQSFLGLTLRPDNRGGYRLVRNPNADTPEEGVVLLDESSMVGANLWRFIAESHGLQWVFIGDSAQLPPVKEKSSPALEQPGAKLESIVRQQAGNPILGMATRIRQGQPYLSHAKFRGGQGVALTRSSKGFTEGVLRGFQSCTPGQPPDRRVLTYRNVVRKGYNDTIRQMLHDSKILPRFVEGDWLMMLDTYMEDKVQIVKNSEEVQVTKAEVGELVGIGGYWKVWSLLVEREDGTDAAIPVLHEEEETRYHKALADYKDDAINERRPWPHYYQLKEQFAKADYCYAMTVHKSQGSTFHTAYVEHRDLMTCRGADERRALAYVAATRPTDRLALLI